MSVIDANDLETMGISAIEAALALESEAVIKVCGEIRYVVMPVAQFHYFRKCELEAALAQSRDDLAVGRFTASSPEEHVERIKTTDLK